MGESCYLYPLHLVGQPVRVLRLKPWELRCMVDETFRQPKRGTRGPRPVPWEVAAKRIERMLEARDEIRGKGDPVTPQAIYDWIGFRGDAKKTIDRWLEPAHLTWEAFLALD